MNVFSTSERTPQGPTLRPPVWTILALVAILVFVLAGLLYLGRSSAVEAQELDLSLVRSANARAQFSTMALNAGPPLVVPAAALRADSGSAAWFFSFSAGRIAVNGQTYCGITPVTLPDGALIKSVTGYLYDNDSGIADIRLYASEFRTTKGASTLAFASTTSNSTSIQAITDESIGSIGNPVDNSKYTYYATTCLSSDASQVQFHGMVIDYGHFANVPLALNNVCMDRMDGRETEPNENRGQASQVCLGTPVKGYPNNSYSDPEFDWYRFEWDGQGTVQVDLTNFVNDGQLILYKGTSLLVKDFNNTTLQVIHPGAGPGTYYVLVTAGVSRPDPGSDYTLTVTVN